MLRLLKWFVGVSVCLGAVVGVANAGSVTVYNNLSATTDGSDSISTTTGFGPLADSFSSGPGGQLSDVQLSLLLQGNPTGQVTAYLYSDSSTSPGSPLYTIGTVLDSAVSPGGTIIDFSGLNYTLAAGTRYWILLADTTPGNGSSDLYWNWSLDTSGVGVASEFFSNQGGIFSNSGNGPYQMSVTLLSVPEPSSIVLLGAGVIGFVAFGGRLRQRRRAAA